MHRVHIDISLFGADSAYGRVSGSIDVTIVPQIGDRLSFLYPAQGELPAEIARSPLLLLVTDRLIPVNGSDEILLSLEDVKAESRTEARILMKFFEECHGLFGEPYAEQA